MLQSDSKTNELPIIARKITLSGKVQGVGFRPFIFRLARRHQLLGWVKNCVGIVEIHAQGSSVNLEAFLQDILDKRPAISNPKLESNLLVEIDEFESFSISQSDDQGESHISVPQDLFVCDDCLAELNNSTDRRYRYPFINCTQCGPRYTLIQNLPYDRPNTTMVDFKMCSACSDEYNDVDNRRFHAEPIACPECGPVLSFSDKSNVINGNEPALKAVIESLNQGKVVAVKGIGGYHLMCDATNTATIEKLRNDKPRPKKPLAVMFPSPVENSFEKTELSVDLNESEKTFLSSPARSILLVNKKNNSQLSEQISPGLNEVGVMLPYSPLHHLLLNAFDGPLVATSANISGEPVLIDNQDIEKRLDHVADVFLHHNRLIERPADDPVFRTIADKQRPIRIGRGVAPIELTLPFELDRPVLAVGAHMKNTIALAWKNRVIVSPHIGEMDSARSLDVFEKTINDLQKLYDVKVEEIICDAHSGYTTTRWAKDQSLPIHQIFHHHAHASATYFECDTSESVLVFSWDGVGYGEDGTLWGGEAFLGQPGEWQRVASMRPFRLPGGDKAGRQPWRSAAALCWETGHSYKGHADKDHLLYEAWERKINTPQTTSVGRLFDGAAALVNVCSEASYEGQGPMELEALSGQISHADGKYIPLKLNQVDLEKTNQQILQTDWQPLVEVMVDSSLTKTERALTFHRSMAQVILQQAVAVREQSKVNTIGFSGGVFQNRVLSECAVSLLKDNGFSVCYPELIPVNDAGISFGQIMEYSFQSHKSFLGND